MGGKGRQSAGGTRDRAQRQGRGSDLILAEGHSDNASIWKGRATLQVDIIRQGKAIFL